MAGFSVNCVVLLMCASLNTCYAQHEGEISVAQEPLFARRRFVSSVEVLLGPGMVFFRGNEFQENTGVFKPGFSVSVGLVHEVNSRVELNPIIAFQSKGNKSIFYSVDSGYPSPGNVKSVEDITTNYATATLFANYCFPKNEKLFIGLGPYFSYLLREKIVSRLYVNGSLFTMSGTIVDPGSDYRRFDTGISVTTGINVRSKRRPNAKVQIVYEKGMIDINPPTIGRLRNNTVLILLGITVK